MPVAKFSWHWIITFGIPLFLVFVHLSVSQAEELSELALNGPANHVRPESVGDSVEPPPKVRTEKRPVDVVPRLAVVNKPKAEGTAQSATRSSDSRGGNHATTLLPDGASTLPAASSLKSLLGELSPSDVDSNPKASIRDVDSASGVEDSQVGVTKKLTEILNATSGRPGSDPVSVGVRRGAVTNIEVEIEKLLADEEKSKSDETLDSQENPENESSHAPDGIADESDPANADDSGALTESTGKSLQADVAASEPFEPSSQVIALRQPLQRCLAIYDHQYLNTNDNACWSTLHSVLSHGQRTKIHVGGYGARTVNAVDWLCQNRPCSGRQIMYVRDGQVYGRVGPGFQGHEGQFLAILAQIRTPANTPLVVGGHQFTVMDLVRSEQSTCREGTELTFKLIGLLHYLPSDTQWTSSDGVQWNFEKLIQAELAEKINGAACGGTHRIMAISQAALKRQFRGEPITGEWWRAQKYMLDYQEYAFALQNPDGSFSTEWFKGRATRNDTDRQIQTTGHILEWLVYSLPKDRLNDPRLVRSVAFLINLMIANRLHEWEEGPKGHAIRALNLFHERVFGVRQIAKDPIVYRRPRKYGSSDRNSVFLRLRNRFK